MFPGRSLEKKRKIEQNRKNGWSQNNGLGWGGEHGELEVFTKDSNGRVSHLLPIFLW